MNLGGPRITGEGIHAVPGSRSSRCRSEMVAFNTEMSDSVADIVSCVLLITDLLRRLPQPLLDLSAKGRSFARLTMWFLQGPRMHLA